MTRFLLTLCAAAALSAAPDVEKIDVWKAEQDGYSHFRIPGIVVTKKGTVLAYSEARKTEKGGDWSTIDIVMKRSTDGGRTWSAQQKIAEVDGPKQRNPVILATGHASPDDLTYNNPVAIADRSGDIHFVFNLEYMRAFYMRSTDDGRTWSKPVEITYAFEKFRPEYDWKVLATGPGHGIQLRSGRLLIPVWLSTSKLGPHKPSVTATVYSDDKGKTWKRGDIAVPDRDPWLSPNETAAVELADGRVMLNSRSVSKQQRRIVTVSPDGATGWSAPQFEDELLEPICMAGMVRYSTRKNGGRDRLLFSNPHNLERSDGKNEPGTSRDRKNVAVHLSYDEGQTWPVRRVIEPGWSAYSDMAVAKDGTILLLYERGDDSENRFRSRALTLARIPLAWLTEGKDSGRR